MTRNTQLRLGLAAVAALVMLAVGCGQVIYVGSTPRAGLWSKINGFWHRERARIEDKKPVRFVASAATGLQAASTTFADPLLRVWQNALSAAQAPNFTAHRMDAEQEVAALVQGKVDFAISAVPLVPSQLDEPSMPLIQLPVAAGALCVAYNLPELELPLNLDPDTVAGLYLGEISSWNDVRLQAVNPNVDLPERTVITVHRQSPSGSTYVFTHYLADISPQWAGLAPPAPFLTEWPARGRSGAGDDGVLSAVQHSTGGVGYVQCGVAEAEHAATARLLNRAGAYVPPTSANISAAVAARMPGLLKNPIQPLVNAPSPGAYPLVGMVYLIMPRPPRASPALTELARWMLTTGATLAPEAGFAPLPPALQQAQLQVLAPATPPPAPTRTAGAAPGRRTATQPD